MRVRSRLAISGVLALVGLQAFATEFLIVRVAGQPPLEPDIATEPVEAREWAEERDFWIVEEGDTTYAIDPDVLSARAIRASIRVMEAATTYLQEHGQDAFSPAQAGILGDFVRYAFGGGVRPGGQVETATFRLVHGYALQVGDLETGLLVPMTSGRKEPGDGLLPMQHGDDHTQARDKAAKEFPDFHQAMWHPRDRSLALEWLRVGPERRRLPVTGRHIVQVGVALDRLDAQLQAESSEATEAMRSAMRAVAPLPEGISNAALAGRKLSDLPAGIREQVLMSIRGSLHSRGLNEGEIELWIAQATIEAVHESFSVVGRAVGTGLSDTETYLPLPRP